MFEVNTSRSLNFSGAGTIDSSVGLDLRARVSHTASAATWAKCPWDARVSPPVVRSLEVRDDRQVPWVWVPEASGVARAQVVLSETSSNCTYYTIQSGMKSPASVGEVPLSKFVSLFGQTGAQTQEGE